MVVYLRQTGDEQTNANTGDGTMGATLIYQAQTVVKVQGDILDTITLSELKGWTEDESNDDRYTVESSEEIRETDDMDEARMHMAEMARELRNARLEEIADRDGDLATETVANLITNGLAGDVLKALKAAGLM